MVNHVPDEVLAAIDRLGEGLLTGEVVPLDGRLRSDLRVRVPLDRAALDAGTVRVTFHYDVAGTEDRLRGHGPFVETVVDGVEDRLRRWGVRPPDTYRFAGRPEKRAVYAGEAGLP